MAYPLYWGHGGKGGTSSKRVLTLPLLCPLILVRLNSFFEGAPIMTGSVLGSWISKSGRNVLGAAVGGAIRT